MIENRQPKFFYGYVVAAACFLSYLIQGIGVGTYITFGVFFKPLLTDIDFIPETGGQENLMRNMSQIPYCYYWTYGNIIIKTTWKGG